ncbi:hypothetical protein FA15DRAFT_732426 [Coprinopsis marcescibilis]|uniref:Uncharacterized protein n=1 Tax=Coprinopsis marcescibilis TaxID=230819 RepID=A0A5C3L142_COPMA|nr:hypothetical protein FA15DRAFT_732426 [Coprinopsis marcescibilis]
MQSIVIDDRDPNIQYSPGWLTAGSNSEFMQTTTTTHISGASARLEFVGTRISVFGTISIRDVPPRSSYTIDDRDSLVFIGHTPLVQPVDQNVYHELFFESPTLSDGLHTLNITNLGTENPLWLDYFLVELPETSRNMRIVTRTETLSESPSTTGGIGSQQSVPAPSPDVASTTVIAIGAVLAGLALLAIAGTAVFLTRRRRRIRRAGVDQASIEPFDRSIDNLQTWRASTRSGVPGLMKSELTPGGTNACITSVSPVYRREETSRIIGSNRAPPTYRE